MVAGFTVFRRVRSGLVIGLIVGLFASAAVNFRPSTLVEQAEAPSGPSAWLERAEFALFDLRMRFSAQRNPAEAPIAFVNVDGESLIGPAAAQRPWPWKRQVLADLLAELDRLGASAIVVEPEFLELRASLDEERAFAERVAALDKVIFGFGFTDLSPEPSPPLGRFAFALETFDTREAAIASAARLLRRPGDALFLLEGEGGFSLWKGGFASREEAALSAAEITSPAAAGAAAPPLKRQRKGGAEVAAPAKAPARIRELTTLETFSRVTRELVFSTAAAMPHPDLADFPSTFRSLRPLPLPLMAEGIRFGMTDLDPEFDGVIRQVRPVVWAEGQLYPSVALAAVRLLLADEAISVTNTHLFVGRHAFSLDDQGRLGLRFYGEPAKRRRAEHPYPEIPALAVFTSAQQRAAGRITDRQLQESVEGKIVFLARTAPRLHASARTPVGEVGSSFAWAMALEDMLRGTDLVRADKPSDGWLSFAMAVLGGLVAALCLRLMRRKTTLFLTGSVSLSLMLGFAFYAEQAWAAGLWVSTLIPILAYAVACVLTSVILIAEGMRTAGAVWDALGRALPLPITEKLIENPAALALDGAHRELTLWLLDLRRFSSWSSQLSPKNLVRLMNEVWTAVSDEICHTRGQLDRVMGDGVFAYWGLPLPNRRHALDACRCALSVRAMFQRRSKSWKKRYGVDIEGAMALSSGELVVGDFGFKGERPRVNYTVMGRALGQVKRLEAMSERWGNRILMTADVHAQVAAQVEARLIGAVRLSDQQDVPAIRIYELMALRGGLVREARERLARYEQALAAAAKRDFSKAAEILEALLAQAPDDLPAQVLLARCQQSLTSPPPENWDGAFEVR